MNIQKSIMYKNKRTTNKRKSLANAARTPAKIQKLGNTPVSQKKNNKSPKFTNKNKKTPLKQLNGKHNIPKNKKESKQTEDDEIQLLNEAENESDIKQEEMSTDDDNLDSEEHDNSADEDKKSNVKEVNRKYSAYIGGLSYKIKEKDLRGFFNNKSILSVLLLKNQFNKKPKGSGFINFKDEAAMTKALSKHGSQFNGRTIKVHVARNKKTRQELRNQINKKSRGCGFVNMNDKTAMKALAKNNTEIGGQTIKVEPVEIKHKIKPEYGNKFKTASRSFKSFGSSTKSSDDPNNMKKKWLLDELKSQLFTLEQETSSI